MKNNVIELRNYTVSYKKEHQRTAQTNSYENLKWLSAITDSIITLTISVCTMFCIYLAYTMI